MILSVVSRYPASTVFARFVMRTAADASAVAMRSLGLNCRRTSH